MVSGQRRRRDRRRAALGRNGLLRALFAVRGMVRQAAVLGCRSADSRGAGLMLKGSQLSDFGQNTALCFEIFCEHNDISYLVS